jgi:hypothetical protein
MSNVDTLYKAFTYKAAREKPADISSPASLAAIANRVKPGGEFVAMKSFKSFGMVYAIGDSFAGDMAADTLMKLVQSGYILPREDYDKVMQFNRTKDGNAAKVKMYQILNNCREEEARMKGAAEAARVQAAACDGAYKDAQAATQKAERDLLNMLQ